MPQEDCHRVGSLLCDGSETYELFIEDYIKPIIPPAGIDLEKLDPHRYFITSGDAVQKTEQLAKDIRAYADRVKDLNLPSLKAFEDHCRAMAARANDMKAALETARGKAIFLETEWDRSRLLCIPKNPRPKR